MSKWISLCAIALFYGCSLHYYDAQTQTEHMWGIGHMKMRLGEPNEGLQAVVHGTDVFGVSLGKADKHRYFTIGWQRLEFIDVVQENTAIRLEWPANDYLSVRVGSYFPGTDLVHSGPEFRNVSRQYRSRLELGQ